MLDALIVEGLTREQRELVRHKMIYSGAGTDYMAIWLQLLPEVVTLLDWPHFYLYKVAGQWRVREFE